MSEKETESVGTWYPAGEPAGRDPSAWYGAMARQEAPVERAAAPAPETAPEEDGSRRKRRRTRIIAACLCGVLLLSGILTAVLQLRRAMARIAEESAALRPPVIVGSEEEPESFDDFREYFANYYTGSDNVTIPRAGADAGVTLTLEAPMGSPLALQEIYDRVSPAVVGIIATRGGMEYSWGTGVVFTPDGYVITNTHIISGCDGARVTFPDGGEYTALLVGSDSASDIAVLKMEGSGFPYAVFGDSDALRVGDEAIAIGNPLGEAYAGTMTNGIISAINRNVRSNGHTMTLLQTNAALNEGNSGGPLVNAWGQVVGITNMKIMSVYTSTVEGIGFAIPSAVVKEIVDELMAYGAVRGEPSIGITAGPVGSEAQALYDLPNGVYVASVDEGSDAQKKGLMVGDIILAVNGTPVASVPEVNAIKDEFEVGDAITLTVYREGETFDMEILLVDRADLAS